MIPLLLAALCAAAAPARASTGAARSAGDKEELALRERPEPSERALVAKGQQLFQSKGCNACHRLDGGRSVGPSLAHLFGAEVELSSGATVRATEGYLRESMLRPEAKVVKGYAPQMPDLHLTPEEVDALVALIRSLK